MKKTISLCLTLLITLLAFASPALAFEPESISTPYIVLMDASSGAVLFEKNSHEHAFPASTTKIMTCILAIEKSSDLEEIVTVGSNVESRGSLMGIVRNEQMRLIDLLYGMMLVSGNDAAQAIAEHISGSEEAFAQLMNQKAAELGMVDTHFVKSNGLHKEDHYSTAYDMALLTRYAMENPKFREIVDAKTWQVPASEWDKDGYFLENSNKLLYTKADKESFEYRYATGVKTGDTDYAGRCLVASAEKNDVGLILVLLGDYSNKVDADYRFKSAAGYFNWGFENYLTIDAGELGLESSITLPVANANIAEGESGNLQVDIALSGVRVCGAKADIEAIKADSSLLSSSYVLDKTVAAPICQGDVLGTMYYKYQGSTLFQADLIASRDVECIGSAPNPNASPLIVQNLEPNSKKGGSTLVFWLLVALALLLILFTIRIYNLRRRARRHVSRRRPTHYRAYRKR